MRVVNIHAAKTHLSRLVDEAAAGESFIIAKAGKLVAQVMAIPSTSAAPPRRRGFLAGQIQVPDNFDRMGEAEIKHLFGSGS